MNRQERRAAAKRNKAISGQGHTQSPQIADLMDEAIRCLALGDKAQAENICHQILARERSHVMSLNMLGIIAQEAGRQKPAIGFFAKAIAADEAYAPGHYNVAVSYQALGQSEQAKRHFKTAIALGSTNMNFEQTLSVNPAVAVAIQRMGQKWPLLVPDDELFAASGLRAMVEDLFMQSVLESIDLTSMALEALLTRVRAALLRLAAADDGFIALTCALARQCFINEYVFAQSADEAQRVSELRDDIVRRLAAGEAVPPFLLALTAAYVPLHSIAGAEALLASPWPEEIAGLLQQQIREPIEDQRAQSSIRTLVPIEDTATIQIMQQYEENPYPRWTIAPIARRANASTDVNRSADMDILIAGCGTGEHALQAALDFPDAQILAIDISRASLA